MISLFLIYNPILIAFSIYPLPEMLFYVILLQIIGMSENTSRLSRVLESILAVLLALTKIIGVLLAVYYAIRAIFLFIHHKKVISYQLLQILLLVGIFFLSEFIVPMSFFGTTPSEQRKLEWNHYIGFELSPFLWVRVCVGIYFVYVLIPFVRYIWQVKKENQPLQPPNLHSFEALIGFSLFYIGFLFSYNIVYSASRLISVNFLLPLAFFFAHDKRNISLKPTLLGLKTFYWFFLAYQFAQCLVLIILAMVPELFWLIPGLSLEFYEVFTSPDQVYYLIGFCIIAAFMGVTLIVTYWSHAERSHNQYFACLFIASVCFGQVVLFFP